MDKTSTIRRTAIKVLLGALVVQAMTPDALDLTLIAHYRPPGPVNVVMSVLADDDDESEHASSRLMTGSPRSASPRGAALDKDDSSDEEPADNIWQPLWPELGLARTIHVQFRALPLEQSYLLNLIDAMAGRRMGRPGGQAVSGRDLSCSLCRITC